MVYVMRAIYLSFLCSHNFAATLQPFELVSLVLYAATHPQIFIYNHKNGYVAYLSKPLKRGVLNL